MKDINKQEPLSVSIPLSQEELEKELDEIEALQQQVEDILHNKNPLVRFFYLGKAGRLHREAGKRLYNLFHIKL